jgi:hypothetical protein
MTQHKDLSGTDLHVNKLHATTHQDGGTDEISLTGLAGAPALGSATTAVTQSAADNSTKVATTAYVDTGMALKANLSSPTFTGTPAASTASPGTNTTQLATTAFTKAAVDAALNGLSWKQAVRAASTANGTLASAFENGDTLDGVTLATGNRILLKNQSTGAENGIYTVNASGAPTRAVDADAGAELVNATCYVSEGTANADTAWTCTNNATPTLGSTALTFAQIGSGSSYTADESTLHLSSTTFSVKSGGITGTEIATDVALAGNPTTTTQTAGNNTTRIATTAFVTAAVGGASSGAVIQVKNTQTGAVATGTTTIPLDDTIPQNTEGTEFMTLAITPTSSTNKLKIEVVFFGVCSASAWTTVALFQDTTANALAAFSNYQQIGGGGNSSVFTHFMTAGTTSSTTFKVRAGGQTASTVTFNGTASARLMGGVFASSITITECVP